MTNFNWEKPVKNHHIIYMGICWTEKNRAKRLYLIMG